jgi:CRISPR/Cas system-associated protein Cas7 (RAMP superfamily)
LYKPVYGNLNEMGGTKSVYGAEQRLYSVLVGKTRRMRPRGRPRFRWADNIKMDLQEVGCESSDWIELAQDRERWRALVSALMNLRVPQKAGNFLTS